MMRSVSRSVGTSSQQHNVPKHFDILPYPPLKVRVHPVVVLTILDAYLRREEGQMNVIGTLLGTVSEGNVVDISDCFVDRHSLTDEGLLQIIKDHHETMYELKQQVSGSGAKDIVVGWFCTGSEMTELTCAVHGWFKQFNTVSKFHPQPPLTEPIHLMVNTTMDRDNLSIKAYMQVPMNMAKDACFQFQELPLELFASSSDRAGLSLLLKVREANRRHRQQHEGNRASALSSSAPSSAAAVAAISDTPGVAGVPVIKQGLGAALEKLSDQLNKCGAYVRSVLDGSEKADPEIGRFLSKALCVEAVQDLEVFEQMCQNALQDNLMVVHLTSLARLQFAVAEKLNTSFF
ncbi:putative eukaryotic translation initiation factor 3 subunit 5 [Neospora caninum Liverpool]|uniref:Eukaryotic translation initiation factor 3 subunit 5, putative n=1 Tax=Neospora caninum (strain Liverpool) TaxID=572307 RepID=F0VLG3_NEOCL|nr:putative eukaryotic translation initiation factor 3 subunit 5 [Neospora caninum Liverpool]CBZ54091.1 putative eukaryotic translation initiation factor 3 subunit 5 [Neospora caninum Liverpool]CEL68789.1 TPA: eukaryotic translation initiation factor 3 subunit 5, putative [Neospora caninum Liverpool]|eukprot:XP_003884122.1 putative eukaryotic translation initiation factor 3 subunit 5 [Neospora caninum Liverpool]